ncbi:NAD(P)-dependent dehydrogenase (short-subunit alcohol dehydrogenase family) [Kibdelosporangium banguiense]|uniref:NAD(P)-dependent dehydrogenase (Short-subunit alcohol dehydrogenase family) n=1 Tax=Kibdelosporangium banguiense TaxID=1365924 RepID=A0ABS4TS93_9PSEU|nr:SDR family oxidoreductase [Kibdelosporangium banguiense]MBP2327268.1 NAD(P)-dependent dehydrogenase (short-subunit alcohol dehydrogenase family) [Kibdelosporangium banguiense]
MTGRRTALITGANRGIGRAVGFELYRRGLDIVVTARDGHAAAATAAEIGPDVRSCALDVTDSDSVRSACTAVGRVDILVCNAGVLLDAGTDPLSVPLDLVDRTLAVNLLGAWRLAQAFVPDMVRRGWGRVVFVSSGTTAEFGGSLFAGAPGYSVSKAALNGLMTMTAAQTAGSGVLVNAVNPGRARTRMMPAVTRPPEEAARDIADTVTVADSSPTGRFLSGRSR